MIDFAKMFDEFVLPDSSGSSSIREIYSIIPTLSPHQIKILVSLEFFIAKYDLKDLDAAVQSILTNLKSNKEMSFWESNSVKQMLRSSTIEELVKGVKPQVQHLEERSDG